MSITVVAWDDYTDGFAEYDDRLRVATLEVTTMAEEFAAGSGQVILDDSTADFYVYPYRPMYFVETAAWGDDFGGIIGPFWTERRVVSRGDERTGSRRVWDVSVRDINSLLSLRVQKGNDAERDAETDVERVDWLINTAEVIGGHGDEGYTIEETEFFFTDAPVDMSESNYTGQYSEGVLNDCMQQSGANGFLYPAPVGSNTTRIGIWYGRTERSEFASLHKISNNEADISPEVEIGFVGTTPQYSTGYVFPPSQDATLDRDPSRQIQGAMVQYDGDYVYTANGAPSETLTYRDMVFSGELIKNATQALARAQRYLDDLATEDDAIECSVIVPDWLVHAWVAGHRVQFKATHLADLGYEDYVWMRVAKVTVRQLAGAGGSGPGVYELALDLRSESPPGPAAPPPSGPVPCPDDTPGLEAQNFYPLGNGTGGNAADRPSPYVLQYHRAGLLEITEPEPVGTNPDDYNSWQFPVFGSGGAGTADYAGANIGNSIRIVTVSAGTLTINGFFSHGTSGSWKLIHMVGAVEVVDQSGSVATDGVPPAVTVPEDGHCNHTYVLYAWTCAGPGRFTFQGAGWNPATT